MVNLLKDVGKKSVGKDDPQKERPGLGFSENIQATPNAFSYYEK